MHLSAGSGTLLVWVTKLLLASKETERKHGKLEGMIGAIRKAWWARASRETCLGKCLQKLRSGAEQERVRAQAGMEQAGGGTKK